MGLNPVSIDPLAFLQHNRDVGEREEPSPLSREYLCLPRSLL
jgi:hypothetical protein